MGFHLILYRYNYLKNFRNIFSLHHPENTFSENIRFLIPGNRTHWSDRCYNDLFIAEGAIIYFTSGTGKTIGTVLVLGIPFKPLIAFITNYIILLNYH
jgi:hypothetical protein